MASIQGLAPLAMNLNPYGVNEEVLAPCIRLQIGKLFTSHSLASDQLDLRFDNTEGGPCDSRFWYPTSAS